MKNNIFILLLVAISGLLYSCEGDVVPTQDIVKYDDSKAPVIVSNTDLAGAEVFVGGSISWDVDIEAHNGIEAIYLNGEEVFAFGNGQLKFSTRLSVEMPDVELHTVKLKVVDEIGLETEFPSFDLVAKGRIPSPYMICGMASDAVTPLKDGVGDDRRIIFVTYANTSNNTYSNNMGWADATVESDMESKQVRFGSPSFNTLVNAPNWPTLLLNFEEQAPDGTPALAFTHGGGNYRLIKLAFDEFILEQLIADVVAPTAVRVFKMDVYVETAETGSTFDFDLHRQVVLGMSSIDKFCNLNNNKVGQDNVMSANITQTGVWETLTFKIDPSVNYIPTKGDLSNNEIDMLLLLISPKQKTETNVICNATYYLKNLRVEQVK